MLWTSSYCYHYSYYYSYYCKQILIIIYCSSKGIEVHHLEEIYCIHLEIYASSMLNLASITETEIHIILPRRENTVMHYGISCAEFKSCPICCDCLHTYTAATPCPCLQWIKIATCLQVTVYDELFQHSIAYKGFTWHKIDKPDLTIVCHKAVPTLIAR